MNADAETTAEPAVDVIMTVYNGETYLAEAVKSVLSQTLIDFALTIVDDGSDVFPDKKYASRSLARRGLSGHWQLCPSITGGRGRWVCRG